MIRVHSRSGKFIALLPDDLQGGFSVVVTANGVDSFSASWPCAHLGNGPIRFEYASNGDLVDESRDTSRADGSAVLALCEDAQTFGQAALDKRRKQLA
jgi:hypothetical protein